MIEIKDNFYEVESYVINCERLVVWGTGMVFRRTNENFSFSLLNKIEYFVETRPTQEEYLFIQVKSINEFLKEQGKLEILICSSFTDEIVDFLKENINNRHIVLYLATTLLDNNVARLHFNEFENFLDQGVTTQTPIKNKQEEIGVYIHGWKSWIAPYYCLTLGVLLKARGLNVRFIYDDIEDQHNVNYEEYLQITSYFLHKIKNKWGIPFDQLSTITKQAISKDQKRRIEKVIDFSMISFTRKLPISYRKEKQHDLDIIRDNCFELAEIMNQYFSLYKFQTVFAVTNLHYALGVVEEICQSKHIHTTSMELIRGGCSYSVNGPAIHQNDIPELILLLNNNERKEFISIANKHIDSVVLDIDSAPFQFNYVLIPLNIYWDSAAYAKDDIFNNNYLKWLVETIEFILENTENIKVVVRQHPHEKVHRTGQDLVEYLKIKFGGNQRFIFIDYNNNVSTYCLIMHSKLVLPNTSTIGLEAICLNKPVITKSKVYYADQEICMVSRNKDAYFSNIKQAIENDHLDLVINIEKAKLYLALTLLNRIKTKFTHHQANMTSWIINESLESLYNECCKNGVFDVFIDKTPILLTQIRSKLLSNKIKLHLNDEDI